MRKEIGSVLLILGIIVIILNTAYLVHYKEPSSRFEELFGDKEKHPIAYVLLGFGIVVAMTGITITIKHKPDIERFFVTPKEYFNKIIAGFTIVRIFASGLLIWALGKHAYEYYTLLRFVVCVATAYGIFLAVRFKKISWVWVFGIIAVLFNPLFPISLERNTWSVIDVTTAILLVVSIFLFRDIKSHD